MKQEKSKKKKKKERNDKYLDFEPSHQVAKSE